MLEHHIFLCIYLFKLRGLPPTRALCNLSTRALTHSYPYNDLSRKEEKRKQMHFRKRTGNLHWNGHYWAFQFYLWFQLLLQVHTMNVAWLPWFNDVGNNHNDSQSLRDHPCQQSHRNRDTQYFCWVQHPKGVLERWSGTQSLVEGQMVKALNSRCD